MTDTTVSPIAATGTEECSRSADNQALKEKVVAAKNAVADLAGEAKRYASHRLSDGKDTAVSWASTAKSKAGDYSDDMVDYVQRNPYKSIAIAVGIGFVAGLILKRR